MNINTKQFDKYSQADRATLAAAIRKAAAKYPEGALFASSRSDPPEADGVCAIGAVFLDTGGRPEELRDPVTVVAEKLGLDHYLVMTASNLHYDLWADSRLGVSCGFYDKGDPNNDLRLKVAEALEAPPVE